MHVKTHVEFHGDVVAEAGAVGRAFRGFAADEFHFLHVETVLLETPYVAGDLAWADASHGVRFNVDIADDLHLGRGAGPETAVHPDPAIRLEQGDRDVASPALAKNFGIQMHRLG